MKLLKRYTDPFFVISDEALIKYIQTRINSDFYWKDPSEDTVDVETDKSLTFEEEKRKIISVLSSNKSKLDEYELKFEARKNAYQNASLEHVPAISIAALSVSCSLLSAIFKDVAAGTVFMVLMVLLTIALVAFIFLADRKVTEKPKMVAYCDFCLKVIRELKSKDKEQHQA